MKGDRRFRGREFQVTGAENEKLLRPFLVVRVHCTVTSPQLAERRVTRSGMVDTGIQTSLKYEGPVSRMELSVYTFICSNVIMLLLFDIHRYLTKSFFCYTISSSIYY